jgi:Protein of unknown function (DUF2490)
MKKYPLATLIILLSSLFTPACTQTQFTGWLASFNTFKTGKKTSMHTDVQWRSTDELKQVQTFLLRPGLNYQINKKWVLTAGYAFISNRRIFTNIDVMAPEHRIWEQLLFTHSLKNIPVSHRLRIEQRFIGKTRVMNDEASNDGYLFANRIRYFTRSIVPLHSGAGFNKGLFAALQNEVFVNLGNRQNVNGEFFDQNRFYIAAGYRLNPKTDLEIGYMNQYVNGRGSQFTKNNIIQLAGYLRL